MRITKIISALAALMLLLALPAVVLAQAQPPRPPVFGGTATLDGALAPDGTTVIALIDSAEVAATTVENGAYAFTIPQPPGESFSGKTVSFLIGGVTAAEAGTWQADGGGELDLTATGTPTPQLTTEAVLPVPEAATETQPQPVTQESGTATKTPKRKAFVGVVGPKTDESVTLIQKNGKGTILISLDNP